MTINHTRAREILDRLDVMEAGEDTDKVIDEIKGVQPRDEWLASYLGPRKRTKYSANIAAAMGLFVEMPEPALFKNWAAFKSWNCVSTADFDKGTTAETIPMSICKCWIKHQCQRVLEGE